MHLSPFNSHDTCVWGQLCSPHTIHGIASLTGGNCILVTCQSKRCPVSLTM